VRRKHIRQAIRTGLEVGERDALLEAHYMLKCRGSEEALAWVEERLLKLTDGRYPFKKETA
jgi:hypothetical protein